VNDATYWQDPPDEPGNAADDEPGRFTTMSEHLLGRRALLSPLAADFGWQAQDLSASRYRLGLAAITLTALVLQATLFRAGLERLSADESARALLAHGLTRANALEPFIWPPFTKLATGLALLAWNDTFVVPHILSNGTGLLVLLTLAALTKEITGDRRIVLVAVALAAVQPYRLLFAVVPLSDIHYMLFLLLSALWTLRWLRSGSTRALLLSCVCLLMAQTVRYEGAVFGLCLGLLVLRQWWRGGLRFPMALAAALLLSGFPVFWAANTWAWYGSLDILGNAGAQYRAMLGENWRFALAWQPMGRPLLLELIWNPAVLLGLGAFAVVLRRDAALRAHALAGFLPLPLTSVLMVATLSLPLAVTWRSLDIWALLMVPWTALGLARLSERLSLRLGALPALTAVLALGLVPTAAHSAWLAWRDGIRDEASSVPRREERPLGLALRAMLEREGGRALVDSWENLAYLDVVAGSAAPWLFVSSAGEDPARVAAFLYLRRVPPRPEDAALRERYLADRFGLAAGGDAVALRAAGVRLLLVREPAFRAALDASSAVERVPAPWRAWALYRMREG
jgi:hypothetical protein